MFNFRHEFTVPNIGFDTLFHFFEILMLLDDFVFVSRPIFFVFYNREKRNTFLTLPKKLREPFLMCHLIFPFFCVFFCRCRCSNVSFSLVLPFHFE